MIKNGSPWDISSLSIFDTVFFLAVLRYWVPPPPPLPKSPSIRVILQCMMMLMAVKVVSGSLIVQMMILAWQHHGMYKIRVGSFVENPECLDFHETTLKPNAVMPTLF